MLDSGELNYVISIEAAAMHAKFMVRVTRYSLPAPETAGNRMLNSSIVKNPLTPPTQGVVRETYGCPGVTQGLYMPDPENLENISSCQPWTVTAACRGSTYCSEQGEDELFH